MKLSFSLAKIRDRGWTAVNNMIWGCNPGVTGEGNLFTDVNLFDKRHSKRFYVESCFQ